MKRSFSFLVAITVVVCWAHSATAQYSTTDIWQTTTTRPPPSGVCGKYFPYDYYMSCWELGGKCYCTDTCKRSNSNNAYCPYLFWDWENAYEICLGQNMTLLNIETQEEDKRIDDYFQLNHEFGYSIEPYLTSGRYSVERNQWEWNPDWRPIDVDYGNDTTTVPPSTPAPGTPIGYSNWYPGRSGSNNKDGHCLGLVFNYGVTYVGGYWDDFLCDYGLMFYYGIPYESGYWDDIDCNEGSPKKNIICESIQ
uniref:C-type lectin domain-containing protein n=1 Tax=Daphnia galeata TaxID=27404 RepID=A0A8J2RLF0_9CRUS|nr:unnamed protein product [Daphnia galeata]